MKKIKAFLFEALFLPIYIASFYIPKKKSLWVFGAWFGKTYSDNTKYLFECVQSDPNIQAIWISSTKEVIYYLKSKNMAVYHKNSFRGIYYCLRAGVAVVASGLEDLNKFCIGSKTIRVNTWHGTPFKKIALQDTINYNKKGTLLNLFKRTRKFFFPYLQERFDYVFALSEHEGRNMEVAFSSSAKALCLTYPRYDGFTEQSPENIITYMPTFRDNSTYSPLNELDFQLLDNLLDQLNYKFYIKSHHVDTGRFASLRSKNIFFVKNNSLTDIYADLIPKTKILITDYSSIFIDFLLLNRPIIFAPFDLEQYVTKDRELNYTYSETAAGPVCRDWQSVFIEIKNLIDDPFLFDEKRKAMRKYFHQFNGHDYSNYCFNNLKKIIEHHGQ